jgi:CRISPR-associated endonuclease Csn1
MSKKLGIDLGSSSLGWFIREDDEIINNGVVTFKTGMTKGQGGYTSPTKDRREARSKRRLIQSRKYRKWELLKALINFGYTPLKQEELEIWSKYRKGQSRIFPETEIFKKWLACDFTYLENGVKYKNPYELRVKAIDNKLSKHEFGRALYHLVQRRGYKDIGEADKETKKQIDRRSEGDFKTALEKNKIIAKALNEEFLKKGKRARNEYPFRAEYEKELITICKAQDFDISKNEKKEYNNPFVKQLRKAIIWQRPLRRQKGNIGRCTLEPAKQRCPASHPIFEIFRTWSYLNTIKYIDANGKKKQISIDFRKSLFIDIFLKKDKNFKFDVIQKHLDKQFNEKKEYNYINKTTKKYDSTVSGMPICNGLIKLFGDNIIDELNQLHTYNIGTKEYNVYKDYSIYDLWHIIYDFEENYLVDFSINKLDIPNKILKNKKGEEVIYNPVIKFKKANFSTSYADLSLKAMCKIIPFLQEGFLYNEAVLLAKFPDIYEDWENNKNLICKIIDDANAKYTYKKQIVSISNNLIDKYKALTEKDVFAYKNHSYLLDEYDIKAIEETCIYFFGNETWKNLDNKEEVINDINLKYQGFFNDSKRRYIELPTLSSMIEDEFKNQGIDIDGEKLYHHSDRKNKYLEKLPIDKETKKKILPIDHKTNKTILPVPLIDSIKNPMFNKSMSILRKLINELIIQEYTDENGVIQSYIDENTEIIVEVARELNDNNKRIAIEKYQREREDNRGKYRQFINEFKEHNNEYSNLNVEENIPVFEMWTEQTFETTIDEKGNEVTNKSNSDIRKEKNAIKRYELWSEQKGQCMYTGKMIRISQLFTPEIEIEHTIPRSLLPDNTMANQTVCYSKYNSDIKNNRIPTACPNYDDNKDFGTAIKPRLKKWEKIRDNYKKLYKDRTKHFGNEDEENKNRRIQEKHYYRMHFDYWKDKVNRFTTEEIKESWVRRQLTDTQMVSKYAREFLKTYFKKVVVQKGSTTADFRKIYSFQHKDEIKNRNKHTHHSIDAAVLTLIPANSSKRVALLNKMYELYEKEKKQFTTTPEGFSKFNAQKLIKDIDSSTLIVNYQKDKITDQTFRNVRKRGELQYLTDKNGNYVLDDGGHKIQLKARGSSIRGELFQQTFIGKIRNVERDENNKPLRNDDKSWKYKTGTDEFTYAKREPIEKAKIEDVIDPDIKVRIIEQKEKGVDIRKIEDHQDNIIRHVRVKTKAGKKVKDRLNYKSKHDYKNSFYSAAGEIPYAVFLTKKNRETIEHKMIPVAIHEVAQVFKDIHKFDEEYYLNKFHPKLEKYPDIKLLKVGQKAFVLKDDEEFEQRKDVEFQMNRMYVITQFKYDGSKIMLKYHLEAQSKSDIDSRIKSIKSNILDKVEKELNISPIIEDVVIENSNDRKKDYEKRKIDFKNRLYNIEENSNRKVASKYKQIIEEYKTESSQIIKEGETSILGFSKNNWNFLFENYDFEIDITGKLTWLEE